MERCSVSQEQSQGVQGTYVCTYMYVYEPVRYAIDVRVPMLCNGMLDRKNCGNKYIPKYVYVVAKRVILHNYVCTEYKLRMVLCKEKFPPSSQSFASSSRWFTYCS